MLDYNFQCASIHNHYHCGINSVQAYICDGHCENFSYLSEFGNIGTEQDKDMKEEKDLEEDEKNSIGINEVKDETPQVVPDKKEKIFNVEKVEKNGIKNNKGKKDGIINDNPNKQFILFHEPSNEIEKTIKKYLLSPQFKISSENKTKRLYHMDSISKKTRQKISETIKKEFGGKLEDFRFKDFNKNTKSYDNKMYLNMTLKDLLKSPIITKNNISNEDIEKILESLENDKNNEKYRIILNMKMEDIYIEFFRSYEYQELILELINKRYYFIYIHNFIKRNENFVNYYKNTKKQK